MTGADTSSIGSGSILEAAHELYRVTPEITYIHLAITLIAAFIVVFGLFSGFIKEKLYVGEAIIACVVGICLSGSAGNVVNPLNWANQHQISELTLELTRVVIALSVFAVGVELPKAYVLRHWRSLAILLGPVMLFGWIISGLLMYAIIPGLEFLPALVIAAGVTPTDPILASSVVGKGKFAQEHVPAHIRHILQAESGSNDGAAFPFLYLALFLLLREEKSVGEAVGLWVALVLLYQIVLGIVIGASVGIVARKILKFSKRRKLIDRESMVAMYVALALLVTGLTTLAGSDDLLAAFAAGTAFAWDDWFTESIEESNFSSTIDLLSNCTIFIYLGATMPFAAWTNPALTLSPWRLCVLAISILLLRRIPAILMLQKWIPDIKTFREACFAAHFGPMGVGAIFIATLAQSKLPTPNDPPETALDLLSLSIQPITYFIVLSSILVHGLTISFFSLSRRVHSRVQSISRTFTASGTHGNGFGIGGTGGGGGGADNEPSWMSRVKRVAKGEDIIINRDDDDDDGNRMEKGQVDVSVRMEKEEESGTKTRGTNAPSGDTGTLAMFGAPSSTTMRKASEDSDGTKTAGSGSGSEEEKEQTEKETETSPEEEKRREADEHPPENVLSDAKEERDSHVDAVPSELTERSGSSSVRERDMAKEDSERSRSIPGEHQVIIDHHDPSTPSVFEVNPSPSSLAEAQAHPHRSLLSIPHDEIVDEHHDSSGDLEGGAVKRAATKILRRGTLLGAMITGAQTTEPLTKEQKDQRMRDKLTRDAWCRKEMHFSDRETMESTTNLAKSSLAVINAPRPESSKRRWVEGNKLVTESADGDDVEVRDLTAEEREEQASKHLQALRNLGIDIETELLRLFRRGAKTESENGSGSGKGKGRRSESVERVTAPGLTLERTSRLEPESEDEEENQVAEVKEESRVPAERPKGARSASALRSVKALLSKRNRSPTSQPSPLPTALDDTSRGRTSTAPSSRFGSRAPSPARSIAFADGVKPQRDSPTASQPPRGLPILGGPLSMRRVPTAETSIRFAEGA